MAWKINALQKIKHFFFFNLNVCKNNCIEKCFTQINNYSWSTLTEVAVLDHIFQKQVLNMSMKIAINWDIFLQQFEAWSRNNPM